MLTILLHMFSMMAQGQAPDKGESAKAPFQITLTTETPSVRPGDPIIIHLALRNNSDTNLDCSSMLEHTGLDASYRYEIKDPNGKALSIRPEEHPEVMSSNWVPCTLEPGETTVREVNTIARIHEMQRPGVYTIQVSRAIQGSGRNAGVSSNMIQITVKGPASNP